MIGQRNLRRLLIGTASLGGAVVCMPLATELVIRQAESWNFFDLAPKWLAQTSYEILLFLDEPILKSLAIFALGTGFGYWLARRVTPQAAKPKEHETTKVSQAGAAQRSLQSSDHHGTDEIPEALRENMRTSDRTDFDLATEILMVTVVRHDYGFDVSAVLRYINRSNLPLYIKPLSVEFEVDGRTPEGRSSDGFSTPMSKNSGANVRLSSITIYEERPTTGSVRLAMKFGQSSPVRCGLHSRYDFEISEFPDEKGAPRTYAVETPTTLRYFVQSEEPLLQIAKT